MRPLYLFILALTLTRPCTAQRVMKRLIFEDAKDSTFLQHSDMEIDTAGNYLMDVRIDPDHLLISKKDTIGPLEFVQGSTLTSYMGKDTTVTLYRLDQLVFTAKGKELSGYRQPISASRRHAAVPMLQGDSIAIYVDGRVVARIDTLAKSDEASVNVAVAGGQSQLDKKKDQFRDEEWLSFNDKGDYLMTVENGKQRYLLLNNRIIDSSAHGYEKLRLNDAGDFIYARYQVPKDTANSSYTYEYYLHAGDKVYGPVDRIDHATLAADGAFYFTGDDGGNSFILINHHLYRGIKNIAHITLADPKHFLCSYNRNGKPCLNVNGTEYPLNYEKIFYPTMDEEGNFACFGLRDYYLYKFVNGKEVTAPVSKYGVRPVPLYISPKGNAVTYYQTETNEYLHRDDELILQASYRQPLVIKTMRDLAGDMILNDREPDFNTAFYSGNTTTGYMVYEGGLSQPMLPVIDSDVRGRYTVGTMVTQGLQDGHFYTVQFAGGGKFRINVDNRIYEEIADIDYLLPDNTWFDRQRLVLYGVKGLSVYQYTLLL